MMSEIRKEEKEEQFEAFSDEYAEFAKSLIKHFEVEHTKSSDYGYEFQGRGYKFRLIRPWSGLHKMFVYNEDGTVLYYSGDMPKTIHQFRVKLLAFLNEQTKLQFHRVRLLQCVE